MAVRDHFRALARRPVSLPATLQGTGTGWQVEARVVDLGLGGACLELPETAGDPLALGMPIRLQVRAPNLWDPLDLVARVSWSNPRRSDRPQRVGLEFQHRAGATLRALVDLLGSDAYE